MKSAAFALSALSFVSAVLAQSTTSTASASTSTVTPSTTCHDFLTQLNADQTVSGCLNALIGATSDFDPNNTSNSANTTSVAITAALNKICPSSFTACDESYIRAKLTQFYSGCQKDLLGPNLDGTGGIQSVIDTYDVLYLLVPLKNAICAKGDNGSYCVNNIHHTSSTSASASASSATHAKRYIEPYKRDSVTVVARGPEDTNSTSGQLTLGGLGNQSQQMRNDGLPYLFMTPETSDAELCTKCTAEVVGAYISFENVTPYALGLVRSPILSGQIQLWQRLKKCNGGQLVRDIMQATIGTTSQDSAAFTSASVSSWLVGGAALVYGAFNLF